jgi:hypothetical protein
VYRVATAAAGSSNGNSRQVLSQHRMWYMFEPAAVLPEYLVAFRYTVSAGSPLAAAAAPSSNSLLLPSTSHSNQVADSLVPTGSSSGSSMQQDPLLKLCAKPLQAWLAAAAFGQLQQQQQQQHEIGTAAAVHPQPGVAELEQRCKSLLEEASAAAPRQQLAALTPSSLSAFVGGQQVGIASVSLCCLRINTTCAASAYLPYVAIFRTVCSTPTTLTCLCCWLCCLLLAAVIADSSVATRLWPLQLQRPAGPPACTAQPGAVLQQADRPGRSAAAWLQRLPADVT